MAQASTVMPDGWKPKHFLIDVDGVMTTGQFFYTKDGKVMKIFGPDDHDALLLLKPYTEIHFVTGDKKGFDITRKRIVDDMHMPLDLISTFNRIEWIQERFGIDRTIYMADGIFDIKVFEKVAYSIAPADAFPATRARANFVTLQGGGNRAVAEAALHILTRFFPEVKLDFTLGEGQGEWGV